MGKARAEAAVTCERAVADIETRGNIVRFPSDTDNGFRLLLRLVTDLVGDADGLRVRVEEIGFSGSTMFIDDFARVFTGKSVKDMHFALDMKEGQKVLLITDKLPVMARFVAGYLIRRHEGDPELASFL
ncbi:hypothetical protein ATER59S_00973 [Aquamicrobium terrae]